MSNSPQRSIDKKSKSKQRQNKFNDVNTISDNQLAKENAYRSLSKGPMGNKSKMLVKELKNTRALPINSSIQNILNSGAHLHNDENYKPDSTKNQFMPSNFSGFYIPSKNIGSDGQDRYNYEIDIGDPRNSIQDDGKHAKKPPIRRTIAREREYEEDDVAMPIEEAKAGSWSPAGRHRSVERHENARNASHVHMQPPRPSKGKKNGPSVPAAQSSGGYEANIVRVASETYANSDSDPEENDNPYKPNPVYKKRKYHI